MDPELERDMHMGDAQDYAHKRSLATSEPQPAHELSTAQWFDEYYRALREGGLL